MKTDPTRIPSLEKSEAPLTSPEAHARALELACRAAVQIMASRSGRDDQEPLPASSKRLLRRLARSRARQVRIVQ
jgi:hypothetical protein